MKSNLKKLFVFLFPFIASILFAQNEPFPVQVGQTVIFTVTAEGTQPFLYEWKKDGVTIHDQTTAILTITNVQPINAGVYACTVSNMAGSDSDSVSLQIFSISLPVTNVSITVKSG